jgi:DNA-binding transcriptional MerR regulator
VDSQSALLDRYRAAEFSLDELAAAAGRLLRRLAVRPGDGRVSEVPDERAIRFYQTAGVVDRPTRYDGRRAVYGYRHLLQLLAVKRLQQEGRPLALIQRGLAGRSTDELERALEQLRTNPQPLAAEPAAERRGRGTEPADGLRRLVAVEVAPGVTLTIDPGRVRDPGQVVARVAEALARDMSGTSTTPGAAR